MDIFFEAALNPLVSEGVFDSFGSGIRPVLMTVPHAGRAYERWAHLLRLPPEALSPLEDPHVDALAAHVIESGFDVMIARTPRAIIDLNRDESDLDPRMVVGGQGTPSRRALGGLGLIPSHLAGQPLWRGSLTMIDVADRLRTIYRPWHAAVAQRLASLRARHGFAVLIDLHSMPPLADGTQIVIGDRYGRTADPAASDAAEAVFAHAGLTTVRNLPYAGGAVIARHGAPASGVHALQIEIDRRLYLDQALRNLSSSAGVIAALIVDLASTLSRFSAPSALAAE